MASQTVENYLKALFSLSRIQEEISISELATHLEVSKPTAHSMIKKLYAEGLVHYEKHKPLQLTQAGFKAAALIVRKHRLTEMYLVERMGFGWEEVHEIAEQMEHIKSPLFFERMDEILGNPKFDPHGSPIPGKDGTMPDFIHRKLSECQAGERVRLVGLKHDSKDFLTFLNNRNLALDLLLEVLSVETFDGSMSIAYQNHPKEVLSKEVCERLLVEAV